MNFSMGNQLETQEGDLEGQSNLELELAFNELERKDRDNHINFENQEEDEVDLNPYAPILDKLSLIDQQTYIDLIKKQHKIKKMREKLVLADLDDDKSDLKQSKKIAAGINGEYDNLVSKKDLKREYNAIQTERDMKVIDNQIQPDGDLDNIEYHAMIAALDRLTREAIEEMQAIEKENGIG